jgi:DNA-binding NarL/FixJ family response regulator
MTVSSSTSRVLIVDDHFFTRMGLAQALEMQPDLHVVAQAANGAEALALHHQHKPDVTLLDMRLPDMLGTQIATELRAKDPGCRCIIFSVNVTQEDVGRALRAGVRGYLPKDASLTELLSAVRSVAAGGRFFAPSVQETIQAIRHTASLSEREQEVLHGMAKGWPNKIIAAEMGISAETVKTFVTRILDKMGSQDRTEAVVNAIKRGILNC